MSHFDTYSVQYFGAHFDSLKNDDLDRWNAWHRVGTFATVVLGAALLNAKQPTKGSVCVCRCRYPTCVWFTHASLARVRLMYTASVYRSNMHATLIYLLNVTVNWRKNVDIAETYNAIFVLKKSSEKKFWKIRLIRRSK